MLLLLRIRLHSIKMNLLSFIRTADPSKVRIGERQRGKDEPQLLDTVVGRVVPFLPIAPARADSELEANVDRLFDEGGGGTHPRRHKKRKTIVADDGEPSHPSKKLRGDRET
ncbi:hypothetical protein Tco_0315518, partial [Tanacetum coccineum]